VSVRNRTVVSGVSQASLSSKLDSITQKNAARNGQMRGSGCAMECGENGKRNRG